MADQETKGCRGHSSLGLLGMRKKRREEEEEWWWYGEDGGLGLLAVLIILIKELSDEICLSFLEPPSRDSGD